MSPPTSLLRLLALAALQSSSLAFLGDPTFGGYGTSERASPYDANSTAFLSLVAASNATSLFHLPLPDISKPFSTTASPLPGWSLSLSALSIPDTTEPLVGYALTLKAPSSLLRDSLDGTRLVNAHPSWGMCIWNFGEPVENLSNNAENKPLSEDGSCAGFLSPGCIAALEKQATRSYSIMDEKKALAAGSQFGSRVLCSTLTAPVECGKDGPGNAGTATRSYNGVPMRYLNGSVTDSDGWLYKSGRTKANSTRELEAFWDKMVLNYWPFVTLMVNATEDAAAPYDRGVGEGIVRVSCVAPNGQGTGKGFNFKGITPARSETKEREEKKNGAAGLAVPAGAMASVMIGMLFRGW